MNIFSIDVTGVPLLYIPIVLLLMTILSIQLFTKTKRRKDLYVGIVQFISAAIAFSIYLWATGDLLQFWGPTFHLSTIAVLLAIGASLFFSNTLLRRQQWPYAVMMLFLMVTVFLSPMMAGTIAGTTLVVYGVFLLIEVREERSNEQILAVSFIGLGVLSFIGHWFPYDGGRFLYSVLLVLLLGYEVSRFFSRVIMLLQTASVNSLTDAMTGLYNKDFLVRKAAQLSSKKEISILFVDIDNFKQLNDTKGHEHGDIILKKIGRLLQELIGQNGYLCRYDGDEMVGIIEHGDAVAMAERLCRQVEKKIGVTVSIGVATGAGDSQALIKLADERMYKAKHNGKNQIVIN